MKFLIFNGEILKYDEISFSEFYLEKSLELTQKVWYGFGGVPLFFRNMELLVQQAEIVNVPLPGLIKKTDELLRLSKRMLNKNRLYRSGFIIFKLISDGTATHTVVTAVPAAEQGLPHPEQGILVTVAGQKKFAGNSLNRYIFFNKPLWDCVLSSVKGTFFDNAVILNEQNSVCECAYGNIYMVKDNEVLTPSLESGCYEDTFRELIHKAVSGTGKKIIETSSIGINDLYRMDEIFIAGENTGIQWLMGVENKRYLHNYSSEVHQKLNVLLESMVS